MMKREFMLRFVGGIVVGAATCAALLFCGCAKLSSSATAYHAPGFAAGFAPQVKRGEQAGITVPEELWVIARSSDLPEPGSEATPGSGVLMAKLADQEVAMPLKHTGVKASVSAYIGEVQVLQQFHNPYSESIEVSYVFPLPHNAAVNEFVMTIGTRRIRGIIREREEAEAVYREAKRQGYVASLLTQERPNLFTQSVANIAPGKQIDVSIRYYHTLEHVDGWYEFVFPMVVGPRFNPPGTRDGVGAVPAGTAGVSRQRTEVPYLRPGQRSGHDIALQLEVSAGVVIEEFRCATHDVAWEKPADDRLMVRLKTGDSIPNRDFVLRYRVAGERLKTGLMTHRDERGGFFTLMLYPPREVENLKRQPLELVFVLDCSGSMNGVPIRQAKAAVERALQLLQPDDSFQIIDFSENASRLGRVPLEATAENLRRGSEYLRALDGRGGTMMIEGIRAALEFPHDPRRLRFVCFLTDGYIGNEAEILAAVRERLGASRIFSFGVGSAPNRHLLGSMANLGRGAVAYLGSRDDGGRVMEDFFARISHPGMTDLRIDWGGLQVSDVFPREFPDLFVGRPVIVTGRFSGATGSTVRVVGSLANESVSVSVPFREEANSRHEGLPGVWARMKIADLETTGAEGTDVAGQIQEVALEYGLISAFTAFVAVDATVAGNGSNSAVTVPVAVPVPEGVNYDTTVSGGGESKD